MDSKHLAGKTCLITGANSGIGKATAVLLAREGARVVMVCRKRSKGEYARVEIEKRSGADSLELLIADLASFQSVRQLAEEFTGKHDRLHVLINNAGLFRVRGSVTVDGFETTLQVNYLSHFLLTNLLLGLLKKSAPSRIVNVSSVAHYGGRIDFDELQNRKAQAGMKAYSQSKLAQVLFTYELSRRLQGTGVTANCLHPGGVATNIWGNPLGPARFLAKVARLFLVSPEKGAETPVYLASSPDVEGVSGQYYEGKRPKQSSAESYDVAIAQQLWRTSSELTGLIS